MVQAIYPDVDKVIAQFIERLKKHVRVEQVILFGSYARGRPRPWSDIDLAIVSSDFHGGTEEDHLLLARVAREVTSQIEALPYSPEDFQNPDSSSFEATILQEGKFIKT